MTESTLVLSQLSQMSAALLAGFGTGIAFDLYQKICYGSLKRKMRPRKYLVGDAVFSLVAIVLILLFWFTCTDGSLRVSVFIWLIIGAALYWGLLRQKVAAFGKKFLRFKPEHKPKQKRKHQHKKFDPAAKGANILVNVYKINSQIWQKTKAKIPHKKHDDAANDNSNINL